MPSRTTSMIARHAPNALLLGLLLGGATPGLTQTPAAPPAGWNEPRVLELLDRARATRRSAASDEALQGYRADARGYVYFYLDRPDVADHVLVKADQVALELYWRAPNEARQRLVGLRDEKVLPTSIRYHLDHMTVVQDDFGDRIRLGDGDEVEQVVHPVGPDSESVYDFQLVDSLVLAYASGAEEVRVYEVQVRPKRMEQPGFVGNVFLDRASGAIVRMNFSFTPASYVDPYLDYIRISLDNSLWLGRHWLPYRQEVELRREMPLLDFSAGSVIRSRFAVRGYEFNTDVPDEVFARRRISSVSPAQQRAFEFEQGLFDEIDEEGLSASTTMEEVRLQVREVVEGEVLSGLAPLRLHLDGLSDFARYNRAEGIYVGGGLTLRPRGDVRVQARAGYAFGARHPSARTSVTTGNPVAPALDLFWNDVGDVGGNPGASRLVNTIDAASGSKDYLDPYFRRGVRLAFGSVDQGGKSLTLRWERHQSATDVISDGPDTPFRPVRSVREGSFAAAEIGLATDLPGGGRAVLATQAGRAASEAFVATHADATWDVGTGRGSWSGRVLGQAGLTNPGAPVQTMFLIGGRHTLPGHDYRAFLGNGYWLSRVEGTVPVRPPYLGLRAFGVVGATYLGDTELPPDWDLGDSRGLRGSVGVGLSIGWDSMFLDVAHGVRGGGWEAVFSVAPRFQGWM